MRIIVIGVAAGTAVAGLAAGPAVDRSTAALAERSDAITAEIRVAAARTAERRHAAAALVRAELTAPEAAGRFETLLAGQSAVRDRLRAEYPGESDDELALRQLAWFVERAGGHPARRAHVMRELDARLAVRSP